MEAPRKHVREVNVATVGVSDSKFLDHLDILFTPQDAESLHFLHCDALIVKLTIAKVLSKGY